jgi:colicin import membrane protein
MHAANDRPEFAPPPEPALIRAIALAVLAHLVLLAALMVGLRWQRQAPDAVAEAELWSSLPVEAAPKPVPAPPPPPPPPPQPVVKPAPPPPPVQKQVDINIEREKQRKLEEQRRQAELERQREEQQKRKLEAQKKREQELAQKKLEEQKLAKLEEQKRKEEEKRRKLEEQKEQQRLERVRKDQLARMQALAGATGAPDAQGRAQHAAGPSATWAGRVQALVRKNITFTEEAPGNPEATVNIRLAPDGTIVGVQLAKSSGNKAWDEAVVRALEKTGVLPRDVDGRVPAGGALVFRPKG